MEASVRLSHFLGFGVNWLLALRSFAVFHFKMILHYLLRKSLNKRARHCPGWVIWVGGGVVHEVRVSMTHVDCSHWLLKWTARARREYMSSLHLFKRVLHLYLLVLCSWLPYLAFGLIKLEVRTVLERGRFRASLGTFSIFCQSQGLVLVFAHKPTRCFVILNRDRAERRSHINRVLIKIL